jgi:hypothetical protein
VRRGARPAIGAHGGGGDGRAKVTMVPRQEREEEGGGATGRGRTERRRAEVPATGVEGEEEGGGSGGRHTRPVGEAGRQPIGRMEEEWIRREGIGGVEK